MTNNAFNRNKALGKQLSLIKELDKSYKAADTYQKQLESSLRKYERRIKQIRSTMSELGFKKLALQEEKKQQQQKYEDMKREGKNG